MTAPPVAAEVREARVVADSAFAGARTHILPLDGIRGLAILLVIVNHLVSLLRLTGTGPISDLGARLGAAGWTGVNLFFALSGFLITGILLDAKGSASYFRAFYLRRVLRIWPVYFGWLAAIFIVFPAIGIGAGDNYQAAMRHQGWYWSHLTNVMMAVKYIAPRPDYPETLYWSLAVEEQFYLVWPFVVASLGSRSLARVCLVGTALSLMGRWIASAADISHDAIYVITPLRLDPLLLGALGAVAVRDPSLREWVSQRVRWIALGALGVIAAIFASTGRLAYADRVTATVGEAALALLFASVVFRGATAPVGSFVTRAWSMPWLRLLGRYSYAMYVIHTAVIRQFDHYLPFASLPPLFGSLAVTQALYFLAVVLEVIAVAAISWYLVERPILSLKRFVPYARSEDVAPRMAAS